MRVPAAIPRLVTAEEMAALDRAAIETRGIPSLTLMERAGKESARAIVAWWRSAGGTRRRASGAGGAGGTGARAGADGRGRMARPGAALGSVLVFCGRGNNGGDGFVAARHLKAAGFTPRALVAAAEESLAPDARASLDACSRARIPVTFLPDRRAWGVGSEAAIAAEGAVLLVDALLGTGSRGAPREAVAAAIELMTLSQRPIVSIDIPSGVDATTGHASIPSIRADLTVTLGVPKVGLALEPGREHAGEIQVIDIGIPPDLVEALRPSVIPATAAWARALLPKRASNAHKGTAGRVLVIGGSAGMMGAVALASHSALRAGAGYCVAVVPRSCVDVLESRVAEVVKRGCAETASRSLSGDALEAILPEAQRADVVAIGPGLSRDPDTERLVGSLLDQVEAPIVLDADGLNAFEGEVLRRGHGPLVVTPHYGEAARLGGVAIGDVARDPLGWARAYASESGAIVCLKSVPMITAVANDPAILNSTGNPGMATAGAGDVLTGTIAGLLAQGMDVAEAAAVGCYVHGLAGDIAARRLGRRGLTAGDIRDALPAALVALESGALDEPGAEIAIEPGSEDWL